MSERSLASVQRIAEIKSIPGADAIEAVRVNGWWVVAKKEEFQVGDLCVYFEIDSVLPVRKEFEFLRKGCYVKKDWLPSGEGFRLRTIKLRGQVSQGLVIPKPTALMDAVEGDVLTAYFGVVKWDPPVPAELTGQARGSFPSFIRKTDQERVQNCYNEIPSGSYVMEEKLEGSSCTIYFYNGVYGVCSRNLDLEIEEYNKDNAFIKTASRYGFDGALKHFGKNIAIQAELVGPGIQGNIYKLHEPKLFVFDVFDIDKQEYLTPAERTEVLNKLESGGLFKFDRVPVVGNFVMNPSVFCPTTEDILSLAEGKSELNMIQEREGVVFKSLAGRFSFKAISNVYLLKQKD